MSTFVPFKKPVKPRTSLPVSDLLDRSDALGRLRVGVQQATALAQDLARLLPDYLVPNVDTGGIQDGTLTLLTGHGALAARLRHLEPGLVNELQQRGWPVKKLKIRISPQPMPPAAAAPKAQMSPTALASLSALCGALEPSPLQESLQRLIAHHTAGAKKPR
jgi:hypothetical protein